MGANIVDERAYGVLTYMHNFKDVSGFNEFRSARCETCIFVIEFSDSVGLLIN